MINLISKVEIGVIGLKFRYIVICGGLGRPDSYHLIFLFLINY